MSPSWMCDIAAIFGGRVAVDLRCAVQYWLPLTRRSGVMAAIQK